MSLFIRKNNNSLLGNSFFDDDIFDNEFFNHPLVSFNSLYPYYHGHPLDSLHSQIEKAFNGDVFKTVDFSPKINLSEDEKNYYIHADLPGLNKDQVKIELSNDNRILTISGERETIIDNSNSNNNNEDNKENCKENKKENTNESKETKQENSKEENLKEKNTKKEENASIKKYSRIECSYGKFSRSFTLPENADINNIQANMENGVLEVNLPKIEPPKQEQRKTIQIQ